MSIACIVIGTCSATDFLSEMMFLKRYGRGVFITWTSLQRNGEAMLVFKRDSFFFEYPGSANVTDSVSMRAPQRAFVREKLQNILSSARSVHDIYDLPHYDYILSELSEIYRLVKYRS